MAKTTHLLTLCALFYTINYSKKTLIWTKPKANWTQEHSIITLMHWCIGVQITVINRYLGKQIHPHRYEWSTFGKLSEPLRMMYARELRKKNAFTTHILQ
jgi:hypothetical protein